MCQPPSLGPSTASEVRSYFKAISDAVEIPIFIQDTPTAHVPAGPGPADRRGVGQRALHQGRERAAGADGRRERARSPGTC